MTGPRTANATLGEAGGYSLIVHGGAGDVSGPKLDEQIAGCIRATERAKQILEAGGSALDAVQAAVIELEDNPRFNAATGGVLSSAGTLELDAAIMEGTELRAGAVCGLSPFKNPIAIARAALDDGKHVLYCGAGAAAFAEARGFQASDPAAMITGEARAQLKSFLAKQPNAGPAGTVGAVARDKLGRTAAATSTGGVLGKRPGRVGDSALLGAGTYADDMLGTASATGLGEGIMRINLCGRIVQALATAEQPGHAGSDMLELMKQRTGARGGVIMIDREGRIGWARSTHSMAYAATWESHKVVAGS